jgi:hypothetical protein
MTRSHKALVLIPPFLIGLTFLMTLFTIRHNAITAEQVRPATEADFEVTIPLPERPVPPPTTQAGESPEPNLVACTMDAKQCPDGSFVGRIPPNCAFQLCPSELEEIEATLEVN